MVTEAAVFGAVVAGLLLLGPPAVHRRLSAVRPGRPASARSGDRSGSSAADGRAHGVGAPQGGLPPPLMLDLVCAVLAAGAPIDGALRVVADCLADGGDPTASGLLRPGPIGAVSSAAAPHLPWVAALHSALELASTSGIGPVPLVRAVADQQRRHRAAAQAQAAQRLAVRLVLPTGLCLLPAFMVLTVLPWVLQLLAQGVSP